MDHFISRVAGGQKLLSSLGLEKLEEILGKLPCSAGSKSCPTLSCPVGGRRFCEQGLGQVFRLRVRNFTAGVFLCSKDFVNEMFLRHCDRFGRWSAPY